MSQWKIKFYTVNSEKEQIETTADNARFFKLYHDYKYKGDFKKLEKVVKRIIEIDGESNQELFLLLENEKSIMSYNPLYITFAINYNKKSGLRIDQKIRRESIKKPFFSTLFSKSRQ